MEQGNNAFSTPSQEPVKNTQPVDPFHANEPIVPNPQPQQPHTQVGTEAYDAVPVAVPPMIINTKRGVLYGILSVGFGVTGILLPNVLVFFMDSSFIDSTNSNVFYYYGLAAIIALLGLLLGAKALRKKPTITILGLTGFVLNLVTITTITSDLLYYLQLNISRY